MLGTDYKILGFIHPYGLCMAVGIIMCFVFLMFTMTRKNFSDEAEDKMLAIGFFATAFGVLMAAIVQGIYNVIDGGKFSLSSMTFQGGLIGGVSSFLIVWTLYIFVVAPRANKSQKKLVVTIFGNHMNATLSDALPFIPPAITIAHAFGRLGCTFAGCCHGAKTDAWYGIWMHTVEYGYAKVVPIQLFECLFLVALSAIMIVLYFKFKFKYNFAVYPIAYGIWRFAIEFARTDDRGSFIPGLSPSQFWSIIMVLLGIAFIFIQYYVLNRLMKHPEMQEPANDYMKKKAARASVAAGASAAAVEEQRADFEPEERLVGTIPSEEKTSVEEDEDKPIVEEGTEDNE